MGICPPTDVGSIVGVGVVIGAGRVFVGASITFRIAVAGTKLMFIALADHNKNNKAVNTNAAKNNPPRITL